MLVKAYIVDHHPVAKDIYLLAFSAPQIALSAKAGQFVHIRCSEGVDPLLRRPFSISAIDREAGTISIIYEIRGRGTKILSHYSVGQALDVLGPLGNWFSLGKLKSESRAILIGGGIGAPPMAALTQALAEKGLSQVKVILGAATKDKLCPEELFMKTGAEVFLATDDGTRGHHGFVTELLPQLISEKPDKFFVFACGPKGMLKAVGDFCLQRNISCQLSLEEIMACGVGACQGCACKVSSEDGFDYVRVCTEGPVFEAGEVVFDD